MGESEPPVVPDALDQYRSMRDFAATPEPAGQPGAPADTALRFVVQEHHATALHWDLRLERDGVLVSWSVPKGIPADPRQNHLAVHTEDHPIEYLEFSGEIPRGNYGAGSMTILDAGTYDCQKFEDREVMVTFHGRRVEGRYVLFQTDGRNWMIHRMDPAADPTRERLPSGLRPMTAVPGGTNPASSISRLTWRVSWGSTSSPCPIQHQPAAPGPGPVHLPARRRRRRVPVRPRHGRVRR